MHLKKCYWDIGKTKPICCDLHPKATMRHSMIAEMEGSIFPMYCKSCERTRNPGSILGDKHHIWKGDKMSYSGLHQWVRKYLPIPDLCENPGCQNPPHDLANVTGIYNIDFSNWKYFCKSCYTGFDYSKGKRPVLGKKHTEEQIKKISTALRARFPPGRLGKRCPRCQLTDIKKNGHVGKKQKYFCNHCQKHFSEIEKTNMAVQGVNSSISHSLF
jgi:hypothetical protein